MGELLGFKNREKGDRLADELRVDKAGEKIGPQPPRAESEADQLGAFLATQEQELGFSIKRQSERARARDEEIIAEHERLVGGQGPRLGHRAVGMSVRRGPSSPRSRSITVRRIREAAEASRTRHF